MKYYLVKETADWADEFTIQGFKLFESESEELLKEKLIRSAKDGSEYPIEIYFGTNEYQEYDNDEAILDDLEIIEITKETYDFTLKLFKDSNIYSFGTTAIL